ncbi:MAG TPA: hypothetical protein VFS42_00275, partial [Burkholderiaceae bacterium]|nr:hypothetical protein [Burkholderiaceae bacterium]
MNANVLKNLKLMACLCACAAALNGRATAADTSGEMGWIALFTSHLSCLMHREIHKKDELNITCDYSRELVANKHGDSVKFDENGETVEHVFELRDAPDKHAPTRGAIVVRFKPDDGLRAYYKA